MAAADSLVAIARMRPHPRARALAEALTAVQRPQARHISRSYLAKVAVAEQEFQAEAKLIRAGSKQHIWDILKQRGLVKDQTGDDNKFREIMLQKRIGAYVGVDPTAPSLHVGHLLPLMALYWLYIHGYAATTLVGGATAKVGDPTGRLSGREAMSRADMSTNITKVHYQLKSLWTNLDSHVSSMGYEKKWGWSRALWNNSQWHSSVSFSEVVHKLFSGVRLGPMLSRDTIKRRLEAGDGVSLSEFVYPMMQAWDWWHMYSNPKQVQMQIGGSDQYGNIISGIEAISHIRTIEPHKTDLPDTLLNTPLGFTVPLLTDSSGAKFGKSSGNAVWLDPFMTSPFDLYGYFMRRPDADVENLLKVLTFLPLSTIDEIMTVQNQDPSKRHAHHALAREVLCLVHGQAEADRVQQQHRAVFAQPKGVFTVPEQTSFPTGGPAHQDAARRFRTDIQLPRSLIMGTSIARILFAAGLCDSISEGHRLCTAQGAYVAGQPGQLPSDKSSMQHEHLTFTPVKVWSSADTARYLIDDKILILRRGKHFVRVVEMISDEEWAQSGRRYPGEPGSGIVKRVRRTLAEMGKDGKVKFSNDEVAEAASKLGQVEQDNRLAEAAEQEQEQDLVDDKSAGVEEQTK
ncbi:tyrosyl-tRNA synthetase [Microdochium trichocladiopsis]|uniref:Tyrosine--tRNA ligase n=1 Tax=Microdochium trichocladiopsis TaxID=1682393 RepID=A0A9P8XXZ6_9PEZI|nr:tyrosyl-tRNA synthetase [Microdochium trichocladiopsis]KAH7018552.1 tyrosyl-tRNA synthetase [Microdochium trichocladiopsis]